MKTAGNFFFTSFSLLLLLNCCTLYGATKLHNGLFDKSYDMNKTPLFALSGSGKNIILGAPNRGMQEAALVLLDSSNKIYRGIAEKIVTVDGVKDSLNPVYDEQVVLLTTQQFGSDPILVTANAPSRLCMIRNPHSSVNYNVLTLDKIKDSENKESNEIVSLAAMPSHFIFAAVKGHDASSFGEKGSGVAIIQIQESKQENGAVIFELKQIDYHAKPAPSDPEKNNSEKESKESPIIPESKTHAIPINLSSEAFKINHDLASIGSTIDMAWDANLKLLYVALQVTSANRVDAGAQAIAVIKFTDSGEWKIEPFASATIFSHEKQNTIFGSIGANSQITIHKLCTMQNSAELPYLVMLGDNLDTNQKRRMVYALPICARPNDQNTSEYGQLAKKGGSVKVAYPFTHHPNEHYKYFEEIAISSEDAFTANDLEALVGGGALKEGSIETIFVHHDLVCAVVSEADEGYLPGIFFSRALLDENGSIVGWTVWQRMSGITDSVLGATIQDNDGSITFYHKDYENQTIAAKQTSWTKNDDQEKTNLERIINTHFSQGIINMTNFYADIHSNKEPHVAILGTNKIAIVRTGSIIHDTIILSDDAEFADTIEFLSGSIEKDIDQKNQIIILSGGELKNIAPLTSVALIANEKEEWLLVGGAKGLAVLTDAQGNGFIRAQENGSIAPALQKNMSFKKISSCRFVRNIVCDRYYAYVLTDTNLERINLAQSPFKTDEVKTTKLASTQSLLNKGCFFDILVSEKLAIIATNIGLIRIGNDKDIASIENEQDAQWTHIPLHEQMGAILHLEAHSSSGKPQDVSRGPGGMLYVLDAAYGKNRSRVHRLTVKNTELGNQIHDATVVSALDLFPGKKNSSHVTLSSSRKKITTDGALLLSFPTADKNKTGIISGGTMRGHTNNVIALSNENGEVSSLIRESASGRWFVGGSFGLLIHE